MSWGAKYDKSVQLADTPEQDAQESIAENLSDALAALQADPPDVAQAVQEIKAAISKGSPGGLLI